MVYYLSIGNLKFPTTTIPVFDFLDQMIEILT